MRVSRRRRIISCISRRRIRSIESCCRSSIGEPPFFFFFSFSPLTHYVGLGDCRFPLVERAVADVPALADPEFVDGIRRHAESLVRRSRGISCTFSLPPCPIILIPSGTDAHTSSPDALWGNYGLIAGTCSRGRSLTPSG